MGVLMRTLIKKSVNVSLAPEILEEARRLKLNLSAVLTAALQEQFRAISVQSG
jgi:antitoxin CcdA